MSEKKYFFDNINHEEIKELYTSNLERSNTVYAKLKEYNKTAKMKFLTQLINELFTELVNNNSIGTSFKPKKKALQISYTEDITNNFKITNTAEISEKRNIKKEIYLSKEESSTKTNCFGTTSFLLY